jgi:hypothetical protein
MMIIKRICLALGGCAIFAASAGANSDPWEVPLNDVPKAGFDYGVDVGLSPQTNREDFHCAVVWDVWNIAYAGNLLDPEIELQLPAAMSRSRTTATKEAWQKAVAKNMGTTPMLAMIEIIKQTDRRMGVQNNLLTGLRGDKKALFTLASDLATCRNPPKVNNFK